MNLIICFLDCHNVWSCCTKENPCLIGEGDCDDNYECAGELACGSDNCVGSTYPSLADCCENSPTTTTTTTTPTTTTAKSNYILLG